MAFVASYHSSLNALCIVVMRHSSLNPPVQGRAHLCTRFSLRSSSSKWCYYKVLAHGDALILCIYVWFRAAFNASGTLRLAHSPSQYWSRRVLPLLCSLVPLFFPFSFTFSPLSAVQRPWQHLHPPPGAPHSCLLLYFLAEHATAGFPKQRSSAAK